MRYTPGGQAVTNFTVASNRQYTASSGERVKETTWFRISAWGRQAETVNQYLKTGSQVLVEGRMTPDKESGGPRVWQRNDGTSAASFEVTAERVVFLSGRGDGAAPADAGPSPATGATAWGIGGQADHRVVGGLGIALEMVIDRGEIASLGRRRGLVAGTGAQHREAREHEGFHGAAHISELRSLTTKTPPSRSTETARS